MHPVKPLSEEDRPSSPGTSPEVLPPGAGGSFRGVCWGLALPSLPTCKEDEIPSDKMLGCCYWLLLVGMKRSCPSRAFLPLFFFSLERGEKTLESPVSLWDEPKPESCCHSCMPPVLTTLPCKNCPRYLKERATASVVESPQLAAVEPWVMFMYREH